MASTFAASSTARQQVEEKPLLKIGHYALGDTLGVGTFGKVKGEKQDLFLKAFR